MLIEGKPECLSYLNRHIILSYWPLEIAIYNMEKIEKKITFQWQL